MRKPDIDALIYNANDGDLQAMLNLMAIFCRDLDPDPRLRPLMAELLASVGPKARVKDAKRNIELRKLLDSETLDRGARAPAYQSVACSTTLSVSRVRNIDRGDVTDNPVAAFAADPDKATPDQIMATQTYIAKLRRLLLSENTKGRGARSILNLTTWRELGKSCWHEEIYTDVEAILATGESLTTACNRVADATGETFGNVKKIFQRIKKREQAELEAGCRADELRKGEGRKEIMRQADVRKALEVRDLSGFTDQLNDDGDNGGQKRHQ
jgi:hypothetical protein